MGFAQSMPKANTKNTVLRRIGCLQVMSTKWQNGLKLVGVKNYCLEMGLFFAFISRK